MKLAEEEKAPESISIEDFVTLSEEKPPRGKVDESKLLSMISKKAVTARALADKFGVSYSAMYARLTKLKESGEVQQRYDKGNAYWAKV